MFITPLLPDKVPKMKRNALVVDDSMLIRHAVCRYFESRGFAVESATNGLEALEMLETFQADIIVTDLQMPKLDGHQLIARLKSTSKTADIPIVVLAGRSSAVEDLPAVRPDHIIYKDVDLGSQLQQVLKIALPGDSTENE